MKKATLEPVKKIKIKLSDLGLFPKWTIKKMVFVAILIAISVAFTVVAAQIIPIVNIPSYKFSFIGLPVKISGFIFGPVIGVFVGIVADLISLLFVPPAGYNPMYTVATAVNGLISGLFGLYYMNFLKFAFSKEYRLNRLSIKINLLAYKYKFESASGNRKKAIQIANKIVALNNKRQFIDQDSSNRELKNIYCISGTLFLLVAISVIAWFIGFKVSDDIISNGFIKNRWVLLALMTSGMSLLVVFVLVGRFFMKTSKYLVFVPIIVFCAFLELINIPILSFADLYSLGNGNDQDIFVWITQHILTSPIKIWFNVFVIYYSYMVVSKLINKNDHLSY
ncbi:ECF transporter S component [Mycoplasma seminis]|uniref:ECF transporter S component n=1 Tax=Mycoplasma seminis TaxID=512749 RepID=A0ABY9HBE7_9MOLU|nr:ECF transporter S component [Mycoplasma seminis]WLP85796.1 ECF transporter S component [Mycoplasma seminis]